MQFFRVKLASIGSLLALSLWLGISSVWALSADIDQDRYLLAAKRYYEQQNLAKVEEYLTKVEEVTEKPSALFYYLKSEVLASKNKLNEQRDALEDYVEQAGNKGEYYTQALNKITDIEEQQQQANKPVSKPQLTRIKTTETTASQIDYVQQLQKLYLVNDEKTVLVTHINSLLASQVYTGSRVLSSTRPVPGIEFSISIDDNNHIVTQKKNRQQTPEQITTQVVNVFGKSLWLTHECQYQKSQCTIRLPDSIDAWLVLAYDEKVTQDLATALQHLIRVLQKSSAEPAQK